MIGGKWVNREEFGRLKKKKLLGGVGEKKIKGVCGGFFGSESNKNVF